MADLQTKAEKYETKSAQDFRFCAGVVPPGSRRSDAGVELGNGGSGILPRLDKQIACELGDVVGPIVCFQPASCNPTIYRKPFSRRKADGLTPTSFRNTRFSWAASPNPTATLNGL
jgi:hypothetical protein